MCGITQRWDPEIFTVSRKMGGDNLNCKYGSIEENEHVTCTQYVCKKYTCMCDYVCINKHVRVYNLYISIA